MPANCLFSLMGKVSWGLIGRSGPAPRFQLISKILNGHHGLCPVDYPVAVGTDDRQISKLWNYRFVELS